ncbi:MAG: hypothetical protein AMJ54_13975 [Deltaproteobacteria bacterium SG8_13]|nr:MAG: hypothetical protein AMJ54_13975 [Deltaproteobacteria bacterium SG8_13]
MFHVRFILRDIIATRSQAAIFVGCVVLALVSLVAIGSFADAVNQAVLRDAKALHAGDVIIRSRQDFSAPLLDAVERLRQAGRVESVRYYEFYSVVRTERGERSLLCRIKVVGSAYPFYGNAELASGRRLADVLDKGRVLVEPALLDRLQIRPGDRLRIGMADLTVADALLKEPDRPVTIFSFGPRVMVSAEDLERLELLGKGSRIRYVLLLKVHDPDAVNRVAGELKGYADSAVERVDTYRTAQSGIQRFFDRFLFFLTFNGIFTLLLAGIGIYSSLTSYLKEKEKTIAIMKTVGATGRFIAVHYALVLLLLGLVGTVIGLVAGVVVQNVLALFLSEMIPGVAQWRISWFGALEGSLLGIVVVTFFALLPLLRLRDIKPASIFRKDSARLRVGLPYVATVLAIIVFFAVMIIWPMEDPRTGAYIAGGVLAFILVTTAAAQLCMLVLKRMRIDPLITRQALRGLFRPRNATRSVIITLTAAVTAIFSIFLVEQNLDATFVRSYPPDAPNLFFLDIQPEQLEEFKRQLQIDTRYYPIIRARLIAINGEAIDREQERRRRRDNLARTFNLTYREELLEDEVLLEGGSLFHDDWTEPQVSILDTVLEMRALTIGDRISFRIQGVPLVARISSIRSRTRESLKPFFYFVFQEKILKDAPQTTFTAVNVDKSRVAALQNAIVGKFPNVSVIDLTQTIAVFAQTLRKFTTVIRFFTAFSILAGLLILISSIFATRLARIREAVYYRILGAKNRFIFHVFVLENLFLGLVSALLALVMSQTASWIITVRVLDIAYRPFVRESLVMLLATGLLVVGFGLLPSLPILRKKPVRFLREQNAE